MTIYWKDLSTIGNVQRVSGWHAHGYIVQIRIAPKKNGAVCAEVLVQRVDPSGLKEVFDEPFFATTKKGAQSLLGQCMKIVEIVIDAHIAMGKRIAEVRHVPD